MKTSAVLLIVGALFACQVTADLVQTPPIDSPINGQPVTLASVDEPTVGDGTTPDGVSVDQTFKFVPDTTSQATTVTADALSTDAPILSVGRKMLSAGRKMLALSDPTTLADPSTFNDDGNIHLTGNGISAGEGGNGVTTTLAGQAEGGLNNGQLTDVHVEPHSDETTITADGKSVSTGAGINPDQFGGEGPPVVYVDNGRK